MEEADRLREIHDCCRRHGLAVTVQRRVVFEALLRRRDHPTADQVYELVRRQLPGIARATVYRVLETLARIGAITKACHPGAATRYDPTVARHHHLVCVRCDKVVDFADAHLDRLPIPRGRPQGFRVHGFSVHYFGLCPTCRRTEKLPASSAGRRKRARTRQRGPAMSERRKPR